MQYFDGLNQLQLLAQQSETGQSSLYWVLYFAEHLSGGVGLARQQRSV